MNDSNHSNNRNSMTPLDRYVNKMMNETLQVPRIIVSAAPPKPQQPKSTDKTKVPLPADFQPTEFSVICGNKRKFFNSPGNRHFRFVCKMFVNEFGTATTKQEKSMAVSKVMNLIREACPVGAFIAFEKGCWWEVSERTAREKVGTYFRDCLADTYKSSSKNKIAQRRFKRHSSQDTQSTTSSSASSVVFSSQQVKPTPAFVGKPAPTIPAPVFSTAMAPAPIMAPATSIRLGNTFDEHPIFLPKSMGGLQDLTPMDDASCSSTASFYDVDDLTPVAL
jgi:hypothetical protein